MKKTLPITLLGALLIHLVVNLTIYDRYPVAWTDEVRFADPAINLALGRGLTSTAYAEFDSATRFPNRPLYPVLLAFWLDVFGISMFGVRSFAHVLAALAAAVAAVAFKRQVPSCSTSSITILTFSWLWSYGAAFSYRSARIEPLIMLLFATAFLAATLENERFRYFLLLLLGVLAGLAGLQSLICVLALLVFCGVFLSSRNRTSLAVMLLGSGAGVVATLVMVASRGGHHAGYLTDLFLNHSIVGTALSSNAVYHHANNVPKSPSFVILVAFLLVNAVYWRRLSRNLKLAICSILGIGGTFLLFAHFPTYYTWLAAVPAQTAIAIEAARSGAKKQRLLNAVLVAMAVVGLPLQLLVSMPWQAERHHGQLVERLASSLEPGETIYADDSAYYAVKLTHQDSSFFGQYLWRMSAQERDELDTLVLSPEMERRVSELFAGSWTVVDRIESESHRWSGWSREAGLLEANYDLVVLKRQVVPPDRDRDARFADE